MQDLNDMMVFLAVVESGSFTKASERLAIPKANVSRKVSRLEKSLGVTLLERSTRSQQLTEAGRLYLTHCQRIHQEMDLASSAVSEVLHQYRGDLKVGASVTIGQQMLKPLVSAFLRAYPELNLQLVLQNQRVDLIEGGYDIVIRVGELEDSRLVAKRLVTASFSLYASTSYQREKGLPKQIDELKQYDFLLMSRLAQRDTVALYNDQTEYLLTHKPKLSVDDFSIIKQSVMDGLGISVLPDYMCKKELASGELIKVLPGWGLKPVDIFALYPKHRLKVPKVKVFLDYLTTEFKKHI